MKNKLLDLSLIISIYDGVKLNLLIKSLNSISNQSHHPKEVLVMLDGVKRSDIRFAVNLFKSKYSNVKVFYNKKNLGISDSYNILLKKCKYNLVAIHDADDISYSKRFFKQYQYLKVNNNIAVLGSSVVENFYYIKKKILKKSEVNEKKLYKKIYFFNPINHPTVMFKRDIILDFKYKKFFRMEDYYLWIRLILNKYRVKNMKEPLVEMNFDKDSVNRRTGIKVWINDLRIQFFLLKNKPLNIFIFLFMIIGKSFYHIIPNFLKEKIRFFFINFFTKFVN
jgi:glycosyltransferase involved in cell wall biosynthesis